jgi:hypothetical protein
VLKRVVGEGLADVDPGVVDQAVDSPGPVKRLFDDTLRGVGFGDVPRDGEQPRVVGGGHRARSSHDRIVGAPECGYQSRADPA